VKTRTLLLLALACGTAILLAGGVLLVQLAGRADVEDAVPIGATRIVGDMQVVVETSSETAGRLDVVVRIGGVEDADGADGFALIAAARPAEPLDDEATGDLAPCGATALSQRRCRLSFDVAGADGDSRVLLYRRGDEQVRWQLGDTA
jgi:hypothetical protein